jgi:hypothetical protein
MIKRAIPFLITIMFFITSCGPSAPQSKYAADMESTIEQLSKWHIHYKDFETLLMAPDATPSGFSRIEMIELYNMAATYQITREDFVDMGFLPLDVLVGDANKFAREGRGIEETLLAVTPDEAIQTTHQAVLECLQTRVAFAEGLAASIRDLVPVDLSGDVSVCGTFDADLEKLTAYVNANQ